MTSKQDRVRLIHNILLMYGEEDLSNPVYAPWVARGLYREAEWAGGVVHDITDGAEYDKMMSETSGKLVILMASTTFCGPCKLIKPIYTRCHPHKKQTGTPPAPRLRATCIFSRGLFCLMS